MTKRYLGDGAYVDFDGYMLVLDWDSEGRIRRAAKRLVGRKGK